MASSSADTHLQRATAYLEDARDLTQSDTSRYEAFDTTRSSLLDARRAHAPAQTILPIYTDLLEIASKDPSHVARVIVAHAIEDFCYRDMKSFTPSSTSHLMRCLHDPHVLVIKRAVRALTTLFRKLIGFAVHVGVQGSETIMDPEHQQQLILFPESRLSIWFQMKDRALSFITHSIDEGLRKASIKFCETVVLALSYSYGAASPEHFTLEYIIKKASMNSTKLLDVNDLEQQGIQCIKTVTNVVHQSLDGVMITSKTNDPADNNNQRGLPSCSFMTAIFVLGNLIKRRPKLLDLTLPPLLTIVSAITGSHSRPSQAFHDLPIGQKLSIRVTLKLSLLTLRGYGHLRDEKWNLEINNALNNLSIYERDEELKKKNLLLQRQQQQDLSALTKSKLEPIHANTPIIKPDATLLNPVNMNANNILNNIDNPIMNSKPILPPSQQEIPNLRPTVIPPPHPINNNLQTPPPNFIPLVTNQQLPHGLRPNGPPISPTPVVPVLPQQMNEIAKRPRAMGGNMNGNLVGMLGPRLVAAEAFAASQALVRSMRPPEVVNFVMTRILLNIPPIETIPPPIDNSPSPSSARRSKKRSATPTAPPPPPFQSNINNVEDNDITQQSLMKNKRRKANSTINNEILHDTNMKINEIVSSNTNTNFIQAPKKSKRSRFGGGSGSNAISTSASTTTTTIKKIVRKTMPPVVALKLNEEARDKLLIMCSRRILKRDVEARSRGAGPLRLQLLGRLVTNIMMKKKTKIAFQKFYDAVCEYVVHNINTSVPFILSCLHCLAVADEFRQRQLPGDKPSLNGSANEITSDVEKKKIKEKENETEDAKNKDKDSDKTGHVKTENIVENVNAIATDDKPSESEKEKSAANDKENMKMETEEKKGNTEGKLQGESSSTNHNKATESANEEGCNGSKPVEEKKVNGNENNETKVVHNAKVQDEDVEMKDVSEAIDTANKMKDQNDVKSSDQKADEEMNDNDKDIDIVVKDNELKTKDPIKDVLEPPLPTPAAPLDSTKMSDDSITTIADQQKQTQEQQLNDKQKSVEQQLSVIDKNDEEILLDDDDDDNDANTDNDVINEDNVNNKTDYNNVIHNKFDFDFNFELDKVESNTSKIVVATQSCKDKDNNERLAYEEIFCKILKALIQKLEKEDEKFIMIISKVICEAPIIPNQIIGMIEEMCTKPESNKKGLNTIYNIIMERYSDDRNKCISLLFKLSYHDDYTVRGPSVRLVANKLFSQHGERHEQIKQMIEQKAIEQLKYILFKLLENKDDEHNHKKVLKLFDFISLMMIALCGQKHQLLIHIVKSFIQIENKHEEAKQILIKRMSELVKHIGIESDSIIQLVDGSLLNENNDDNKTVEELALTVVQDGVSKHGTGNDGRIVKAGMKRYELNGNMEFVIGILEGLSREEVLKLLKDVIDYCYTSNQGIFKQVITKITSNKGQAQLRSDELLMHIHKVQSPNSMKSISFAIKECFECKGIFEQESIAQAIQQMMDENELPDMLMRTIILARSFHSDMEGYLTNTVMKGLISKKVWLSKTLWDGFLRYCCVNNNSQKNSTIKLLLSLPVTQLEDALSKKHELVSLFKDVVKTSNSKNLKKIPPKHRKVIVSALKKK